MLSLIKSTLIGLALTALTAFIALGVSVFTGLALFPAIISFGAPLASLIYVALPASSDPSGGVAGFFGLSLIASFLQLSVAYAVGVYFLWFSRHAR